MSRLVTSESWLNRRASVCSRGRSGRDSLRMSRRAARRDLRHAVSALTSACFMRNRLPQRMVKSNFSQLASVVVGKEKFLFFKQRLRELFRVEGLQVVRLLA